MRRRSTNGWLTAAALLWLGTDPAAAGESTAAAVFSRLPAIQSVRLSPDGQRAVMLRALGDSYQVTVADFSTGKINLVMASKPDEFLFNWCEWANNDRLICSYRSYVRLRAGQLGVGVRWYRDGRTTITRLLAADWDGGNVVQLVPEAVTRPGEQLEWNAPDQDTIISWLPKDPDTVLIQLARDDRIYPSVYRLDVYRNRLRRVKGFDRPVLRWYADHDGVLRFASGLDDNRPVAFSVSGSRLAPVEIGPLGGIRPPELLAFDASGERVYLAANHGRDRRAIYRIRAADAEVMEPLHIDPDFDADHGLVLNPRTREPLVLQYPRDTLRQVWFDHALESTVERVRQALAEPPAQLRIADVDNAVNRLVLYGYGNGTVPAYYLYDRAERNLLALGALYPEADAVTDLRAARAPTRDGAEIPVYYALPGPAEDGPYPVVLLPHGGPWARDTDDFDYWAQFLISSGYAVVKPNYRGSTGYGDTFLRAGFEQWGMRMQDDSIDALDWMIGRGFADARRACIVGGSYGGYAALVAAYQTPERFRCAVSFAGVTDLDGLVDRWRNFTFGQIGIARVQDGAARRASSPLDNVERMAVPLLIVHGDLDRNVMIEQSQDLVKALAAAGKDYEYIELPDGDHHLSVQSHRQTFFTALGRFLDAHLTTLEAQE